MDSRKLRTVQRDPFAVDPLPKAYYYPSPEKQLSGREKSTSVYLNCSYEQGIEDEKAKKPSPVDEMFLRGTNTLNLREVLDWEPVQDDNDFDESWPASERPSSISLTGLDESELEGYQSIVERFTRPQSSHPGTSEEKRRLQASSSHERLRMPGTGSQVTGAPRGPVKSRIPISGSKKPTRPFKTSQLPDNKKAGVAQKSANTKADGGESILQKYVERFRNSAPMSREDRQKKTQTGSKDFWWLSQGETPVNEDQSVSESHDHEQSPWKQSDSESENPGTSQLTKENLNKYEYLKVRKPPGIMESPGLKKTQELQDRADRLLEKSLSSTASTEPAVSTEGLGSNISSDVSGLEEYSYRPKFARYLDSELPAPQARVVPTMPGQRPLTEDDPLYQWRLRRRIETAQKATPIDPPQQFDFLPKSDQQRNIEAKLEEFKHRLAGKPSSHRQSNSVQFTPAPTNSQPLHIDTHTYEESRVQPQIASPSLKPCRPQSDPLSDVDPHFHLMCDLLPCPHRGQYEENKMFQSESEGKQKTSQKFKGGHSEADFIKGDNICDKGDENVDKAQYKQYLRAEKPDVESNGTRSYEGETSGGNAGDRPKNKHGDLEKIVQDIMKGESDTESVRSERRRNRMDKDGDTDRDIEKCDSARSSSSRRSDRSSHSKRSDHESDQRHGKHRERESVENSGKASSTRHGKQEKCLDDKRDGGDKRSEKETRTVRQSREEKNENVIKPKHSSSPVREKKEIGAAIGMVVKEHLFSTSMSTVLSSVDSLPPTVSKQPRNTHQPAHDNLQEEQGLDSDGEFSEDQLLIILRKQRAVYEQQLHAIDEKLQVLER
ncbi:uncharacterized protein LOC128234427 [Mya arenaria]|uniref:uncharacterized protein LOC128234427 n=1 Tax=Mya arenaria TaxID=6604 RepID=UPI0022E7A349|nr:uncharacterized protein LOC128234427 [Mya arenaria]